MFNYCLRVCFIIIFISTVLSGCNIINPSYIDENVKEEHSDTLTIDGSTSMTKLCNSLGEVFSSKNEEISVEKLDTGSSASVESVMNGTSMIGALSRNLKNNEPVDKLNIVKIADDGICIIINKNNKINNLNRNDIFDIFTKRVTSWDKFNNNNNINNINNKIVVIGREEASGTKDGFESAFGLEGKCQYDAIFSESGDILSQVGNDTNAIGYVSMATRFDNVKAVSIEGITPTYDNIKNGTYPVIRPFIMVCMKDNNNSLISSWFDFVFSREGKSIIEKEGFISIGDVYE